VQGSILRGVDKSLNATGIVVWVWQITSNALIGIRLMKWGYPIMRMMWMMTMIEILRMIAVRRAAVEMSVLTDGLATR